MLSNFGKSSSSFTLMLAPNSNGSYRLCTNCQPPQGTRSSWLLIYLPQTFEQTIRPELTHGNLLWILCKLLQGDLACKSNTHQAGTSKHRDLLLVWLIETLPNYHVLYSIACTLSPVNQPVNQRVNQPVNQPANQPVNQSVN